MNQTIELLPQREALAFDIFRFTDVRVFQNVTQGNFLAGLAFLGNGAAQNGNAIGIQNVAVNQL